MIPQVVVKMRQPNCLEGRMLEVHFSQSVFFMSNLGEITPHLLILPISSITILLDLWSSMISNSPMYPCFCITLRNFTTTLETGWMMTCFFPAFSAFTIVFKQSAKTFTFTILRIINIFIIIFPNLNQNPALSATKIFIQKNYNLFFSELCWMKKQSFRSYIPVLLLLSLSHALYSKSINSGCSDPDDFDGCIQYLKNTMMYIFSLIFFSALVHVATLICLEKRISVLYTTFFFYYSHNYNTGANHEDFSAYNSQMYKIIFVILSFIYLFLLVITKLSKNYRKLFVLINISGLVIILYIVTFFERLFPCKKSWYQGLGSSEDTNTLLTLKKEVKICVAPLMETFLDVNKILSMNCQGHKETESYYYFYQDYPYLGIPNLTFGNGPDRIYSQLPKLIIKNLQKSHKKLHTDVQLIRQGQESYFDINIIRNEEKIQKLNQIKKAKNIKQIKKVLAIFIDNIARQHFFRMLPKTAKFLSTFYKNTEASHQVYQFFRYQNVGFQTNWNMSQVIYGNTLNEYMDPKTDFSSFVSHNKFFSDNGFITGHSVNFCQNDHMMSQYYTENMYQNFPYDHSVTGIACLPELYDFQYPFNIFLKGGFSARRRCTYKKDSYEYIFEFGKKFLDTYDDQNTLLQLDFLDAHEFTSNNIKTLDEPLFQFLSDIEKKGSFKNTHVILYSDHGHHHHPLYFIPNSDAEIEQHLPTLFYMMPQSYREDTELKKNEDKTILPLDIYNLFLELAGEQSYMRLDKAYSVFENIPDERKCDDHGTQPGFNCIC